MNTILITGGAGYIGSHTLLELAKLGKYNKLVVFDNLKNGNKKAIEIIQKHTNVEIDLVEGDLLNKTDLDNLFKAYNFNAVIHFAALIEAGLSMKTPARFFENNINGTVNLIQAMQKNNVRKIVFSSTAAVYGTPKTFEVTENNDLNPENWYGFTKYVVENLLESLATEHTSPDEKIDSVILRYFNAAGANPESLIGQDYPNPTHLITLAIQAALGKREKLTIFGKDYDTPDGTCIRDYIHVEDLASAHVKALEYLESFSGKEIINVGTGKGHSNLEVVKELEKIHGSFNYEFGEKRPGDPSAYYANNSKAKTLLNWQPKYDIQDIIKHAYMWAKNYPDGYKNM